MISLKIDPALVELPDPQKPYAWELSMWTMHHPLEVVDYMWRLVDFNPDDPDDPVMLLDVTAEAVGRQRVTLAEVIGNTSKAWRWVDAHAITITGLTGHDTTIAAPRLIHAAALVAHDLAKDAQ